MTKNWVCAILHKKGKIMKKITIAICYDFDKTLTTDDMQSFAFIPSLNLTSEEFWDKTNSFIKKNGCDVTLGFLRTMIDECRQKGIVLSREYLKAMGKNIPFAEGVLTWFKRLNTFAEKQGAVLEHYVISSGNKEMIEGTKIFKEFKNVFACEYLYGKNGEAYWPKNTINYTTKTQCLFRICKGAHDLTDEKTVNNRTRTKHVEFRNMIYLGDGITDIPCMTLVKEKGGTAIAVYQNDKVQIGRELIADGRVNYVCRNSYKSGSSLEKLLKTIIKSLVLKEQLLYKEKIHKKIAKK